MVLLSRKIKVWPVIGTFHFVIRIPFNVICKICYCWIHATRMKTKFSEVKLLENSYSSSLCEISAFQTTYHSNGQAVILQCNLKLMTLLLNSLIWAISQTVCNNKYIWILKILTFEKVSQVALKTKVTYILLERVRSY